MDSTQIIAKLQAKIHQVLEPLTSKRFAILDFPNHANVGDSAIWLGEMIYFKKREIRNFYVCTQQNERIPEGIIFLHGGGNFGDIWSEHQQFRENVIERYPERKIVQLPQSIYFSSQDALRRSARIINKHKDFTLLVRDQNSLSIAQEAFSCRIELCPDMAFCLGAIERPTKPTHKKLFLLRTDKEKRNFNIPPDAIKADWLEDDDLSAIRMMAIKEMLPSLGIHAFNKYMRREFLYRKLAEARLQRGLRLLSSSSSIVTDRLHAHILCILLNIPHTILDNSYGKISGFYETWTKESDLAISMNGRQAFLFIVHTYSYFVRADLEASHLLLNV
jgi:pyruvyl transferase EpsO